MTSPKKVFMKRIFFLCLWFAFLHHISFAEQTRFPLLEENFNEFSEAAQKGDAVAQNALAICYRYGLGTEEDHAQARKWYFEAAKQENDSAIGELANLDDSKEYVKEVIKLYTAAAQNGDAKAQYILGQVYYYAWGVEKNWEEANKCYFAAAKQGNTDALQALNRYDNEQTKLLQELFEYYLELAPQGNADIQTCLAECYFSPIGPNSNREKAIEWYLSAGKKGNAEAQYLLGCHYTPNIRESFDEEKWNKAFEWFLKSAKQGNVNAQFRLIDSFASNIGEAETRRLSLMLAKRYDIDHALKKIAVYYERGWYFEKDLHKAFQWRLAAAVQGDAFAQYFVGRAYEYGYGIEKNLNEAFKWYLKSATKDTSWAVYSLAQCYAEGKGVEKNLEEAVKWYLVQGVGGFFSDGKRFMAKCYAEGKGVEKNLTTAFFLYSDIVWSSESESSDFYIFAKYNAEGKGSKKDPKQALAWYLAAVKNGIILQEDDIKYIREAANEGNSNALYILGFCYENGWGLEKNLEEAFTHYLAAVKQEEKIEWHYYADSKFGDALANYSLAKCYAYGIGTETNIEKAFEHFFPAFENGIDMDEDDLKLVIDNAQKGNANAQYILAEHYRIGIYLEKDLEEAFNWYIKAAEQGNKEAQLQLITSYEYGSGVKRDLKEAYKWHAAYHKNEVESFEQFAKNTFEKHLKNIKENRNRDRNYYGLALLYENGEGIEKNMNEAFKSYFEAAKLEYKQAQIRLIEAYENGEIFDQDFNDVIKKYIFDKNNKQHDWVKYILAICYEKGIGVEKNAELSMQYYLSEFDEEFVRPKNFNKYLEAAKNGNTHAQYIVANCYAKGLGVEKNDEEAFKWYLKASPDRWHALLQVAIAYEKGIGVEKNLQEAFKYYLATGDELKLGEFYLYGKAVEKNLEKAMDYFKYSNTPEINWYMKHYFEVETPDPIRAYAYCILAANRNVKGAKESLKLLGAKLSDLDKAAATRLARKIYVEKEIYPGDERYLLNK